jgi:hypothetical protein
MAYEYEDKVVVPYEDSELEVEARSTKTGRWCLVPVREGFAPASSSSRDEEGSPSTADLLLSSVSSYLHFVRIQSTCVLRTLQGANVIISTNI